MDLSTFDQWANDKNLTPPERERVLREARAQHGQDLGGVTPDDLDEVARALGLFVSSFKALFRFFRGLF